jgi:hypothetical protein
MHAEELPEITSCNYAATTGTDAMAIVGGVWPAVGNEKALCAQMFRARRPDEFWNQPLNPEPETTMPNNSQRRIVQVFIADPDENIPLESAVLFKGEQKFTDLTDQELFFELPIKDILDKHNFSCRANLLNKEATKRTGKDIKLEPIKVRDLRMVVVNIATF